MARFFVTASNIFGGVAYLSGKDAEHIKVLRIRHGESFTVCDGAGTDYVCRLSEDDSGETTAEILEKLPSPGEPDVFVSVYAAYAKGDKIETIVQKCVELGAGEIVLFPSARCISRPEGGAIIKKQNRWQAIAEEAAKQSGRGKIPQVLTAVDYKSAVQRAAGAEIALFPYEEEKILHIKTALERKPGSKTVSIMTGPEGGFTPEEAAFAAESGLVNVSLGPRILRCETAPLAAVTAVMLISGNM